VIDKLAAAVAEALRARVRERLAQDGAEPVGSCGVRGAGQI
jgi:hypothetical protein